MADTVCVDWDDTLVDARTQQWLPGARGFLNGILARGYRVVIHTCRANWPEGAASVEASLANERFRSPHVTVMPKPDAVLYVDNLAARYHDGNYSTILHRIQPTKAALRRAAA